MWQAALPKSQGLIRRWAWNLWQGAIHKRSQICPRVRGDAPTLLARWGQGQNVLATALTDRPLRIQPFRLRKGLKQLLPLCSRYNTDHPSWSRVCHLTLDEHHDVSWMRRLAAAFFWFAIPIRGRIYILPCTETKLPHTPSADKASNTLKGSFDHNVEQTNTMSIAKLRKPKSRMLKAFTHACQSAT